MQVKPHATPSHEAVAFAGGAAHGEQAAPHVAMLLLSTHTPLHKWKPPLHVNPQLVPSHVAVPFAGAEHAVHDDGPQFATSALLTQLLPHR